LSKHKVVLVKWGNLNWYDYIGKGINIMQNKLKYLTPVIAALLLSACGRDEPTATYYPAVPYQNPDTVSTFDGDPEMVLPNNEYAPYARTIFGFGGGVQDVYFDHYRGENYRIRNYDGVTIAFMIRQLYGDYLIVDEYDRILFSLTYTSGDMYRIVDPLGFHYGFLSYNYEGSFVAMDTRQRMYHNVWFMPLYFAYPVRNRYYRYHRMYDWRHAVPPPEHMTNPDDAPKNRGNRRGKKRLDDDRAETYESRRIVANRSRNRAGKAKITETMGDRERFLDRETQTRIGGVSPKKRTNYKAKPETKTNQGQATQTWSQKTWSMGEEDITRAENNRARQRSLNNAKAIKVRQQQRQRANELRRQHRAPETRQFREDHFEADRQRAQSNSSVSQQPQRQRSQRTRPQIQSEQQPQARQQTRQAPRQAPAPQRQQQSRPQQNYQKPVKSSSPKASSKSRSKPKNRSSGSSRSSRTGKPKVHN
jgi:hypothetical protein